MAHVFQLRQGTDEDWLAENPILFQGEVILVAKSPLPEGKNVKYNYQKIGDGESTYEELPYIPIQYE
jgi:hypothetical protein